jgi:hypothetical protein
MGLEFLYDALNLPMTKLELMFRKALMEYSERRPMKKTEVFNNYDLEGYITMPEGTTSCRIARYGVLPNQMPRYYMPTFDEMNVEFDPTTLKCRTWPPVTPLRLTYTQRYMPTRDVLIKRESVLPYETFEYSTGLECSFADNTLHIEKYTTSGETLTMDVVGIEKDASDEFGHETPYAILKGTLGDGEVNLDTKELELEMTNSERGTINIQYYPKYYLVKELSLGDYIFIKLFTSKFITALASLRAQATQAKLHNIDLTTDELYTRARELKEEVRKLLKSTISFGDMSPM